MTGARAGLLMRAAVSGAADLPDIELELGPITALVGAPADPASHSCWPRARLITGRPRPRSVVGGPPINVSATLSLDGRDATVRAIRSAACTAPTIRLNPDFEAVAGIASRDDKVLPAWERFARGRAAGIPAPLASVVHAAAAVSGEPGDRSPHPATTLPGGSSDF